jgi:chromosome segregation ATPase
MTESPATALAALQSRIDSLQTSNARLTAENQRLKFKNKSLLKASLNCLHREEELDYKKTQLSKAQAENERLVLEMAQQSATVQSLQSERTTHEKRILDLSTTNASLLESKNQLSAEVTRLRTLQNDFDTRLDASRKRAKLHHPQQMQRCQLKDDRAEVHDVSAPDGGQVLISGDTSLSDVDTGAVPIAGLKAALFEATKNKPPTHDDSPMSDRVSRKILTLRKDLALMKDGNAALEANLSRASADMQRLSNELAVAKVELAFLRADHDKLLETTSVLAKLEVDVVGTSFTDLRDASAKTQKELAAAKAEHEALKVCFITLHRDLQKSESDNSSLRSELASLEGEARLRDDKVDEARNVSGELDTAQVERPTPSHDLETATTSLQEEPRNDLASLESENIALKTSLTKANESIALMENKAAFESQYRDHLFAELQRLKMLSVTSVSFDGDGTQSTTASLWGGERDEGEDAMSIW